MAVDTDEVLARLRTAPTNSHVFRGFGPLVAAAILLVVMTVLAPSIAPEHVVQTEVPADTTDTGGE